MSDSESPQTSEQCQVRESFIIVNLPGRLSDFPKLDLLVSQFIESENDTRLGMIEFLKVVQEEGGGGRGRDGNNGLCIMAIPPRLRPTALSMRPFMTLLLKQMARYEREMLIEFLESIKRSISIEGGAVCARCRDTDCIDQSKCWKY